jgi:arylsulfatase A-like enzyme
MRRCAEVLPYTEMRNVVLVCLDSVRKDYFEEYAPRLRERADVAFQQCRAASSWSVPSHASMFTGTLPSEHGVHTHNTSFDGLVGDALPSRLEGHRTACVSANGFTTEEFGFDALFDELVSVSPGRRFHQGVDAGGKATPAILREALTADAPLRSLANGAYSKFYWLVNLLPVPSPFDQGAGLVRRHGRTLLDDADEPVFLFTNFMEGHLPHQPRFQLDSDLHSVPRSWSSTDFDHFEASARGKEYLESHRADVDHFRQLYAANVDYLDRRVDRFVDEIRRSTTRETTVVVTADHGENLGYEDEDYLMGHSSSLSEALLHVPLLVVNPPPGWTAPETDRRRVSHLDLPRIVESLAYEGTYEPDDGVVTAELVGGGAKLVDDDPYWDRMIRCAYLEEGKYVWDSLGSSARFELDPSRPCKQTLVETGAAVPGAATDRFAVDLAEYKSRVASGSGSALGESVDAATRDRLEDLGYL